MNKKEALRKLQFGGFDAALNLCHSNQRIDVKLELSIWLNNLKNDHQLENNDILGMIRLINKQKQQKNILKQQKLGIIDEDKNQKVFFKTNDFFLNKSNKTKSSSLSEDDIKDLLRSCINEFYNNKVKQHQDLLFLYMVRKYTQSHIAELLNITRDQVKYLLLSFKKNGLYDLVRKRIKEVLNDKI